MKIDIRRSWIFLMFLGTLWTVVVTGQTHVEQSLYRIVKFGRNITGIIKAEITTKTELECSLSCTIDEKCTAYKFEVAEEKNCGLINENSTQTTFLPSPESHLYKMDQCYSIPCQNAGTCIDDEMVLACKCPQSFRGRFCEIDCSRNWECPPVVHRNLDSEVNLLLMNGSQIVLGKIGNAVKTNRDHNQYVDLGVLSEACITKPETCGPEGAAISFWFKLHASTESSTATGFTVACTGLALSLYLVLEDEARSEEGTADVSFNEWYHFACSFTNLDNEERIKLFYDGIYYNTNNITTSGQFSSGSGRVLIGRAYADFNMYFTSLELDELLFFNQAMEEQGVQALYQQHV